MRGVLPVLPVADVCKGIAARRPLRADDDVGLLRIGDARKADAGHRMPQPERGFRLALDIGHRKTVAPRDIVEPFDPLAVAGFGVGKRSGGEGVGDVRRRPETRLTPI